MDVVVSEEARQIPQVTVIVPTHNRARLLTGTVRSVLQQTHRIFEVLIVDDGSSDDTSRVCSQLQAADERIRYIRTEHRGPGPARNRGLTEARSRWVSFLDDDDLWLPETVERLLRFAVSTNSTAVACRALRFHNEDPNLSPLEVVADPERFGIRPLPERIDSANFVSLGDLLLHTVLPLHSLLFNRERLLELGGFDPEVRFAEDYDLLLRIAAREPIPLMQQFLALYRWHPQQRWASLRRRARETRLVLVRLLHRNPDWRRTVPSSAIRKRLASLARETAYAELLVGERGPAAKAAARSIMDWPFAVKPWLYLAASVSPRTYAVLRKSLGRGPGTGMSY